ITNSLPLSLYKLIMFIKRMLSLILFRNCIIATSVVLLPRFFSALMGYKSFILLTQKRARNCLPALLLHKHFIHLYPYKLDYLFLKWLLQYFERNISL